MKPISDFEKVKRWCRKMNKADCATCPFQFADDGCMVNSYEYKDALKIIRAYDKAHKGKK